MVSLETIEREIDELENRRDTTYRLCERLAWLYICRDHLRPDPNDNYTRSQTFNAKGSEFLEESSGVPITDLMQVLDEHMNALRVVQPKEYEAVMRRIRALH